MASIDQATHQLRQEIQALDREIRTNSDELVRLGHEETKHYGRLAQLRLDQLTSGQLVTDMDDADRRVTELLHDRVEAIQALQRQIEQSDRRQSELEAERTTRQRQVHAASEVLDRAEAVTQQRLASAPAYQEQLERSQRDDRVAKHAEEKAQQSERDRTEKGQQYEADALFLYLSKRGYGTSNYSANPLARLLDGWVAKLCRYHDARPNYAMLLEIPKRLRDHADAVRADADHELAALKTLEEQAAAVDGIPALRDDLRREQQCAQEIDAAIQQEEIRYGQLVKERSQFAGGEDEYSRQCLQVLVDQLRREPLVQLHREAATTVSAEDDIAVQQLTDLEKVKRQLESELAEHKQRHLRHLERLQELQKVRRDFKTRQYDDVHSTFPKGELVGAMLTEFLRGMAHSGQLWSTIERQHRRRRIEADPTFGSGGFDRPSGGAWNVPMPTPRGEGGFRTGGHF